MNQTRAASEISAQVADIRAPADDRARERVMTIFDGDVAICVIRSELSVAERVLIAEGHSKAVSVRRQSVESSLAPAMRAAVERTTGRIVRTVEADCHVDPDITVLTFTFAPAPAASGAGPAADRPLRSGGSPPS